MEYHIRLRGRPLLLDSTWTRPFERRTESYATDQSDVSQTLTVYISPG